MTGISSSELSSSCAKEANQRRNNNLLHAQTSDAAIMLHASHNGNHRVLLRPVCRLANDDGMAGSPRARRRPCNGVL